MEQHSGPRGEETGEGSAPALLGWLGYRDCLPYNKAAYVIIAVSFGAAFGLCWLVGDVRHGTRLAVGGSLATALDLGYRVKAPSGHWLHPGGGARFFFLPLWAFGLIWLALGVAEVIAFPA